MAAVPAAGNVPAAAALPPPPASAHAIMFAQSESAKWLWQFFEAGYPHWGPAHTLPKAGSKKWHGDAEERLRTFLRDNNHGLGQVRPLPCPAHSWPTHPLPSQPLPTCLSPSPAPPWRVLLVAPAPRAHVMPCSRNQRDCDR